MRVVIACGGTGGHLFPGLAVAEVLKERGNEILLLVSEKAVDAEALKMHPEFRAEKLPSVGLPAVLSPGFVRFVHRTWESMAHCKQLFRRFQPDAVLGMGGFTSTPPLLAARLRKIPTFLHESNAIPGKANRLAGRFVNGILLGFDACRSYFPNKHCTVTGTPVRKDLGQHISREEAHAAFQLDPTKRTILVTGGSQGASGINQLMFKVAPLLKEEAIQIIHLTGERDDRLAAANYLREKIPAYVAAFHHQMCDAYSAADLILSRAGAASLSEISHFSLPAILVPYPFAADHHQERNAQIYVSAGAAEMFLESETNPDRLARTITNILGSTTRHQKMAEAAAALAPKDAATQVVETIEKVVETQYKTKNQQRAAAIA